jgi:hypothetical protein
LPSTQAGAISLRRPRLISILLLARLGSSAAAARAQSPPRGGVAVPVFSIAKSENKNQVQYVVRVDEGCAPLGPAPMSAYWRMLENGASETEPILSREIPAYGLRSQEVIARDASGGQVRAVLNALPGRSLIVATSRGSDGVCRALATVSIAGAPAHLFNVYVHLMWLGVDYVLLQGWSMDGTHVVRERLTKA